MGHSVRVVICGTFVPGLLGRTIYGAFGADVVLPLPNYGMGHTAAAYTQLEPELMKLSADGAIELLGDSQGALVAAEFCLKHPDRVQSSVWLSGPFDGTTLAKLLEARGTRCMRPGSRHLAGLRGLLSELPAELRVSCVSSGHDMVVWPTTSAFIDHPRIENYCLSALRPTWLDRNLHVQWVPVKDRLLPLALRPLARSSIGFGLRLAEDMVRNHLGEVVLPETARFVDSWFCDQPQIGPGLNAPDLPLAA